MYFCLFFALCFSVFLYIFIHVMFATFCVYFVYDFVLINYDGTLLVGRTPTTVQSSMSGSPVAVWAGASTDDCCFMSDSTRWVGRCRMQNDKCKFTDTITCE